MLGGASRFRIRKSPSDVSRALQYVIRTAYREVTAYQRLWSTMEPGIARFRTLHDLPMLTPADKQTLLQGDLRSRLRRGVDIRRCVRRGTSGMTGPPIDILFSKLEFRFRQFALLRRVMADLGIHRPFRWAEVGAWVPLEDRNKPLRRGSLVSILRLPRSLEAPEQIEALRRFNPDVVSGCPSDLQLLAAELPCPGGSNLTPKLVICRGEVLRRDAEELIASAFGCRVTDYYNVQEVGNLALRCLHNPNLMHVNSDTAVLEIVDSIGNPVPVGTEGEVLVTNLFNVTMPFIRYRLNDRASWIDPQPHRCTCGLSGPSLSPIQGRSDDLIQLPDGRQISPRVVDDLVIETLHAAPHDPMFLSGVHTYQIVQEAVDRLVILIETSRAPSILMAAMERGLEVLHPAMQVTFEFVERLPRGETGKIRRVVSKLEIKT